MTRARKRSGVLPGIGSFQSPWGEMMVLVVPLGHQVQWVVPEALKSRGSPGKSVTGALGAPGERETGARRAHRPLGEKGAKVLTTEGG